MRVVRIILVLVVLGKAGFSQPLTIQWQKCLGGTKGEEGRSIKQTVDGKFVIGSNVLSNDGDVSGNHAVDHFDYWIAEVDSLGTLQWQKCYGGSTEEKLQSIALTEDHGFIVAGSATSTDGDVIGMHAPEDYWVVKCDSTGNIQWQRCLGGSDEDLANKVIRTYDHGYLVIGFPLSYDYDVIGRHDSSLCHTCPDAWVVKLDSAGIIKWSKCFGGFWGDIGYSIIETADSGYVIASAAGSNDGDVQGLHGVTGGHGPSDYWIVKIDSIGTIQWQKCFGGSETEIPSDIICTYDGGYIVTGTAESIDYDVTGNHGFPPEIDAWIVKLDIAGNMQWEKCLGGSWSDYGQRIIQLQDSGYLALCNTISSDGNVIGNHSLGYYDVWLAGLDTGGNLQWQQCIGGTNDDAAYDIQPTSDGGFIFTGITFSNDGDVSGNHGNSDVWVVKLTPLSDYIKVPANSITDLSTFYDQSNNLLLSFYHNGTEKIQLQLIDITGRILFQQPLPSTQGLNKHQLHTSQLSSGLYLVRLVTEIGTITKKLFVPAFR